MMPALLVIQKLAAELETTMASLMEELEGEGESGPSDDNPPIRKRKG